VILVFQVAIGLLIPDSLALLESAVLMIVLSPLYAGQFLLALKVVRDEPARFNDLFAGFPRVGSIILARLAVAVMIILGSIALIFPGLSSRSCIPSCQFSTWILSKANDAPLSELQ